MGSDAGRLMNSGNVPSTAATLEEYNRVRSKAINHAPARNCSGTLSGPRKSPQFNVAQPWVKGYNGEVSLISKNGHYSTVLDPGLDRSGSEAGDGLLSESLRDSTS